MFHSSGSYLIWAASWQNQQNDCAQRRLRSAWASAQSDQSLRSALIGSKAKDPSFLHADSENCDQTAVVQADMSLRWTHMPFCWFSHEAAELYVISNDTLLHELKIFQYASGTIMCRTMSESNVIICVQ